MDQHLFLQNWLQLIPLEIPVYFHVLGLEIPLIVFHNWFNVQEYLDEYVGSNTRRKDLYQVRQAIKLIAP